MEEYKFTPIIGSEKIKGCYLLWDNGIVVYVGQSTNIWARVGVHLASPIKKFDGFSYCEIEGNLNDAEAELIVRYKPKFNSSLPNNSFYASSSQLKKVFNVNGWEWRRLKQISSPVWLDYYKIQEIRDAIK